METSGVLVLIYCLVFVNCDKNVFGVKRSEFQDRMASFPDINTVIQELKEMQKHQIEIETNVIRNQLNLFNKTAEIESNLQMKQNEIDTNLNTMISNQNQLFHKLEEKENETRTNQNKMQLKINEIETIVNTMIGNQNQLFHKLGEIKNKLEIKQNEIEANQNDLFNKMDDLITGQSNLMNKVNTILRLNVTGTIEAVVLESIEMVQSQLVRVQSATQNVKNSITTLSGQIQTVKQNVAPKLYCNNRLGLDDCLEKHFADQQQLIIAIHQPVWLVGGRNKYEGRVEMNYQGRRGTICDDNWDDIDAQVICRMLGFSGGTSVCTTYVLCTEQRTFGGGTGEILLSEVRCSGSEQSIFDCGHSGIGVHNCNHHEDAGVR